MSDANTTLGDFHDGSNAPGSPDYTYDSSGNMTEDLNKGITNIHYNYLNLPDSITFSPPAGEPEGARYGSSMMPPAANGKRSSRIKPNHLQSTTPPPILTDLCIITIPCNI